MISKFRNYALWKLQLSGEPKFSTITSVMDDKSLANSGEDVEWSLASFEKGVLFCKKRWKFLDLWKAFYINFFFSDFFEKMFGQN